MFLSIGMNCIGKQMLSKNDSISVWSFLLIRIAFIMFRKKRMIDFIYYRNDLMFMLSAIRSMNVPFEIEMRDIIEQSSARYFSSEMSLVIMQRIW